VNEFYEYLMLEMAGDIKGTWEDESQRAHELCFLLSLDGHKIPESFFKFYSCNVDVPHEKILNAAAFFSGMGLIEIECDCKDEWKTCCDFNRIEESEFYEAGEDCMTTEQEVWYDLIQRVVDVREAFGVGETIL
jgi:hypothetical protein